MQERKEIEGMRGTKGDLGFVLEFRGEWNEMK